MRKTNLAIMAFLSYSLYAEAQLNIVTRNSGLKEYTVQNAQPYDSLTNVEERSFAALPGQTLYMHGARNDSRGYYDTFFTGTSLPGAGDRYTRMTGRAIPLPKRWWESIMRC